MHGRCTYDVLYKDISGLYRCNTDTIINIISALTTHFPATISRRSPSNTLRAVSISSLLNQLFILT